MRKTARGADLTKGQEKTFPALEEEGGTPRGGQAPWRSGGRRTTGVSRSPTSKDSVLLNFTFDESDGERTTSDVVVRGWL